MPKMFPRVSSLSCWLCRPGCDDVVALICSVVKVIPLLVGFVYVSLVARQYKTYEVKAFLQRTREIP